MEEFVYAALGEEGDTIRLLAVDAPASQGGLISCWLEEVKLQNVVNEYIALSHVWSQHDPTFQILLREKIFFVTPSLWQFLHLASERLLGQRLWIDAICIDQSDSNEKEKQIPLMRDIFSQAKKTVAWMDSPLHGLYGHGQTGDPNIAAARIVADEAFDIGRYSMEDVAIFQAVFRLFFNQFWSRVWIVQEIKLSPNLEFWWEGQTISLAHLERLDTNSAPYLRGDPPPLAVDLGKRFARAAAQKMQRSAPCMYDHNLPLRKHGSGKAIDLALMVCKYEKFGCSVPFDRVYALLGLVDDGDKIQVKYNTVPLDLLAQVWRSGLPLKKTILRKVGEAIGIDWSIGARLPIYSAEDGGLAHVIKCLHPIVSDAFNKSLDTKGGLASAYAMALDQFGKQVDPFVALLPEGYLPTKSYEACFVAIKRFEESSAGTFTIPHLGLYFQVYTERVSRDRNVLIIEALHIRAHSVGDDDGTLVPQSYSIRYRRIDTEKKNIRSFWPSRATWDSIEARKTLSVTACMEIFRLTQEDYRFWTSADTLRWDVSIP